MAGFVYGVRMYGKVDRVPGVCHVATMFAHVDYLPLFPIGSCIVLEGTGQGDEFRGVEIGFSLKSVAAGYLRVWGGLATVVAGISACLGTLKAVEALGLNYFVFVSLLMAGLGALTCLFVGGKVGATVQVGVHIVSVVIGVTLREALEQKPVALGIGRVLEPIVIMNVALLIYGLMRFFDYAGPIRRQQLLRRLGVEVALEDGNKPKEKPEKKWEDWDENEDRRRRGC